MSTSWTTAPRLAFRGIVCGLVLLGCTSRDSIAQNPAQDPPPSSTLVAEEPEKVANTFVVQNQRLAEDQLKVLKEEAEKLEARLTRVKAGIDRWKRVVEALKQTQGTAAHVLPPSETFGADLTSYFRQPFESSIPPPEGAPNLEGKKVVILCNATSAAAGEYPSLERDVPRTLADILRKNVKKITIVEPDKVSTWVEAHPHWTEPADAARDFGADIAIFLEVEQFQSQSPGDLNMVHGDSKVHIQVFELDYPRNSRDKPIKDQPKESRNVHDSYAETNFPERGPLPIDSGTSRRAFAQAFLKIVVKEISWHFIPHREE
jgi:hypothetical protein